MSWKSYFTRKPNLLVVGRAETALTQTTTLSCSDLTYSVHLPQPILHWNYVL